MNTSLQKWKFNKLTLERPNEKWKNEIDFVIVNQVNNDNMDVQLM